LRAAVSHTVFKAGKTSIQVTASFGLCGMDQVPSGEHKVAEQVLRVADAALYRSKETGRNRVRPRLSRMRAAESPIVRRAHSRGANASDPRH